MSALPYIAGLAVASGLIAVVALFWNDLDALLARWRRS